MQSVLKNKSTVMAVVLAIVLTIFLTACSGKNDGNDKTGDVDFTVVGSDEQPQTLKDIISEKSKSAFQISYIIDDDLYIVVGYGEQPSGGYSITVNEVYETKENIVVDTTLLGPGDAESVTDTPTTPYIVIKMQNREDKIIQFK